MLKLKRTLTMVFALLVSMTLVACGKEGETIKGFEDYVNNIQVSNAVSTDFVVPSKHTIKDENDVTLVWTSSDTNYINFIEKSDKELTAKVNPESGTVAVTLTVKATLALKDKTEEKTRDFTVNIDAYAVASGDYDFKYVDSDYRFGALAALEKYMLDSGIGAPLFDNGSASMYNPRIQLPTGSYMPIMGFGARFGKIDPAQKDSAIPGSDYNYRTYDTASITDINPLTSNTNSASSYRTYLDGSLFDFYYTDDKKSYKLDLSMAESLDAVNPDELGTATEWKVTLRKDLKWENGTQIKAADFVYLYQRALDPVMKNFRASVYYQNVPLVGAESYYKQTTANPVSWDTVGIKAADDFTITYKLYKRLNRFDFMYNASTSPLHKATFEAGLSTDGKTTTYGTSKDTYMASGPYKLNYWTTGTELRFVKNDYYFEKALFSYTGVSIRVLANANTAFQLFLSNELDACGLPADQYNTYKNDPRTKLASGAVGYRLTFNRYTQAQSDAKYGTGAWQTKAIMQEDAFMEALYFALDRNKLAKDIMNTPEPVLGYLTNAYVDPVTSIIYRESEHGISVLEGYSPATNGYNLSYAKACYKQALDSLKAKNLLPADKKITLKYAGFSSPTQDALNTEIKRQYEAAFNGIAGYEDIVFTLEVEGFTGYGVYDYALDVGKFDIALLGISGSTLDPWDYLGIFLTSDPYQFFYSLGFDTYAVDLKFDGKVWSFEALWAACNGPVTVENGLVKNS